MNTTRPPPRRRRCHRRQARRCDYHLTEMSSRRVIQRMRWWSERRRDSSSPQLLFMWFLSFWFSAPFFCGSSPIQVREDRNVTQVDFEFSFFESFILSRHWFFRENEIKFPCSETESFPLIQQIPNFIFFFFYLKKLNLKFYIIILNLKHFHNIPTLKTIF